MANIDLSLLFSASKDNVLLCMIGVPPRCRIEKAKRFGYVRTCSKRYFRHTDRPFLAGTKSPSRNQFGVNAWRQLCINTSLRVACCTPHNHCAYNEPERCYIRKHGWWISAAWSAFKKHSCFQHECKRLLES
jgi:hypothetical protein